MTSKIVTWLDDIGHVLKKLFTPGAIQVEASIADILLPGFSPLINSAASAIISAESAAAAAGVQQGTGVQKLAYATSLFQTTYNQWAAANNLSQEPAAAQALLQQVFNLIQALKPAGTAPAAPAAPASVATQVQTGTLL